MLRAIDPALSGAASAPASQLELTFSSARGRTYLSHQRVSHPFHLCRSLYRPDDAGGLATVYVQGCAGGLFEHDRIHGELRVEGRARAHVTTAASTIVHRMPHGGHAEQQLSLSVSAGALLEYCPDPLILFPGSRLRSRQRVRLEPGGRAILTEAFLGHRLRDDQGRFDWLDCTTEVRGACGRLLARERYVARGARLAASSPGGSGPYPCQASVLVLGQVRAELEPLRLALSELPGVALGASSLPADSGLIVRILALDAVGLRAALELAWCAARRALGEPAGRTRPK